MRHADARGERRGGLALWGVHVCRRAVQRGVVVHSTALGGGAGGNGGLEGALQHHGEQEWPQGVTLPHTTLQEDGLHLGGDILHQQPRVAAIELGGVPLQLRRTLADSMHDLGACGRVERVLEVGHQQHAVWLSVDRSAQRMRHGLGAAGDADAELQWRQALADLGARRKGAQAGEAREHLADRDRAHAGAVGFAGGDQPAVGELRAVR